MLLDVIIWLPTLFTYVLFLLILLILFFIVAYVSHKIYISIYDNLPLPAAPGRSFSKSLRSEQFVNQISARSIWIPNRSTIFETTAVRVTISLEPCYLVNLELDIQLRNVERPVSFLCNCQMEGVTSCAATEPRLPGETQRINKFYTHLCNIPRLKILLKCNERSKMRLVLDDVIQDVMESRCTDSGPACRRPKPPSSKLDQFGASCSNYCKVVPSGSCKDVGSGKVKDVESKAGSGRDQGASGRENKGSGREDKGSGREDKGSGREDKGSGREDKASGRADVASDSAHSARGREAEREQ